MSIKLPKLALVMVVALVLAGILACDIGGAAKPTVTVTSPPSGTKVQVGEEVNVESTASDAKGVVRVELAVDGSLYRTDASPIPEGQPSFSLVQAWKATDPGTHTLTVTAYNVDGAASDPWAITVEVIEAVAGATPTPTATSTPTPTSTTVGVVPTTTSTPVGLCTDNATFVTDVTVPDGTSFSPGATINKVWRMKNSGTCPWGAGYELAFVSGAQMGAPAAQAVLSTAPGGTADIGVTMYAPSAAGSYTGTWRMRSPTGVFFGRSVTIAIQVVGPATPVPPTPTTAPPTPTEPAAPSAPPEITSFLANGVAGSIAVAPSTTVTLSWSYERTAEAYLDPGDIPLACPPCTYIVTPAATTTYKLRAYNAVGSDEETVTVNVTGAPPPAPPGPTVLYDFVEHICDAAWTSGAGALPCPGGAGDHAGFVRAVGGNELEDGSTWPKALETHPQWVNNGWIQGKYHLPSPIQAGDRFVAKVGFLKDAAAGNVRFMVTAGTNGGGTAWGQVKPYNNSLVNVSFEFDPMFEGASYVSLRVLANGPSAQDWAVWVEPRIERP